MDYDYDLPGRPAVRLRIAARTEPTTEPTVSTRNHHRQECPRCGGQTARVRRLPEERAAGATMRMRRYRCTVEGCGWEDTIATAPGAGRPHGLLARQRARARQFPLATVGISVAAGLVLAVAGAQAWHLYRDSTSVVDRIAAGRAVLPFGASHDGDPLAPGHPLLVRASTGPTRDIAPQDVVLPPEALQTAALQPAALRRTGDASDAGQSGGGLATDDASARRDALSSVASPATPSAKAPSKPAESGAGQDQLQIRQDCAWGDPGRNPYRGTIEEALEGARLPAEVVERLAGMIRAGQATDRLEITNASIRTVHQYREYNPRSIAMTFGKTLCVNTRVNFKPDHMERADLYEVADASGATYSVMVPYVCGNVSVLSDREERPGRRADHGAGPRRHAGGAQVHRAASRCHRRQYRQEERRRREQRARNTAGPGAGTRHARQSARRRRAAGLVPAPPSACAQGRLSASYR